MISQLPSGLAARNPLWPEARWNLTGLFVHDLLTLQVFSLLHERFGCPLKFDSIHGAPDVPWNCGRFSFTPAPTAQALEAMLRTFNDVGIGVFFTFSNHLLDKNDLDDRACNRLLESIDNGLGLNGVILASDLLYDHIRRRHPELKLTASIIKVTEERGRGNVAYYQSVLPRFDSVMVHPDDGFNCEVLDQLDRDKIEIMVNENCAFQCPNRVKDYEVMAQVLKAGGLPGPDNPYMVMERRHCRMPLKKLTSAIQSCNFPTAQMVRVYEMGFRRFKLQGRQDMPATFLFSLLRFAIEPDILAPVIYKAFISGRVSRLAAEAVTKTRAAYQRAPDAARAAGGDEARQGDLAPPRPMIVQAPVVAGDGLPTGAETRHPLWPDARWTIEGMATHGRLIREMLALLADRFDGRPNVERVCGGGPGAGWNGARQSGAGGMNMELWARTVRQFNDMGVGVRCLFNDTRIASADLNDDMGNRILEILDDGSGLNGVGLASDVLADHIRSRHPGLKLTASAVKTIVEGGGGRVEHYQSLAKRFDTVALCSEDGFDEDLLAQLDRDRIEILVNDDAPWCGAADGAPKGSADRRAMPMSALDADVRSRNFTTAELKRVYDLGYRRFRLQSAGRNPNLFLYDILRYTLEPNLLLPVVFKSFTNDWAREQASVALDGTGLQASQSP
ncbi:MAG TPA: hypothetical protein ENH80_12560 [Phycisphaerae bacterium]|nr:hypothetical protein [Phycisphaerae bacterium]HDZ44759.1 hypothetical protein [Phycisphaerae bacterium]